MAGEASQEERPSRGVWLTKEMEKLNMDLSKEPTKEEIRLQLRMPKFDENTKDPICTALVFVFDVVVTVLCDENPS